MLYNNINGLTSGGILQLSTNDLCIYRAPDIPTYAAPNLTQTNFYLSFIGNFPIPESQISIITYC